VACRSQSFSSSSSSSNWFFRECVNMSAFPVPKHCWQERNWSPEVSHAFIDDEDDYDTHRARPPSSATSHFSPLTRKLVLRSQVCFSAVLFYQSGLQLVQVVFETNRIDVRIQ
jgi:hypothetical protein